MDVQAYMQGIGKAARTASRVMAVAKTHAKNTALTAMALAIERAAKVLLHENSRDVEAAKGRKLDAAAIDRLSLTTKTIESMADGLRQIAALPDPIGEISELKYRPSGIQVGRMRVPLGVIGIIFIDMTPRYKADLMSYLFELYC